MMRYAIMASMAAGMLLPAAVLALQQREVIVELGGLKAKAPSAWKRQEPPRIFRRTRKYQFILPRAKGDSKDGEMRITYFGKGGAGGFEAVVDRWKGMFRAPKGKTIDEVAKIEKWKLPGGEAAVLDLQGTYLYKFPPFAPNAKVTPLPDYRMFAVVFQTPQGPYYIVATGPARTMAAHKKAFDDWLKSFRN